MMKNVFIFLLILSFQSKAQCDGRYQNDIFQDIDIKTFQYGSNTNYLNVNQDLFLDVYSPKNDTVKVRPCVVFCFGGAFIQGKRTSEELVYIANFLAKKGYVCVSIDYRLDNILNMIDVSNSAKAVIRAVQDAKAAIRFLKNKSDSLMIDTNQIFIGGTSAGGVTAMTMGYAQYNEFNTAQKVIIDALGGYEGQTNTLSNTSTVKGLFNFSGGIGDTAYINKNDLPIYLNHSTGDKTVPFVSGYPLNAASPTLMYGSYSIMKRMQHQGGIFVIDSFVNSNHPSFSSVSDINMTAVSLKNFLFSQLKCNNNTSNISLLTTRVQTQLFPNPIEDYLYFESVENINTLSIWNTSGQLLLKKEIEGTRFNMSKWKAGNYFISINHQIPTKIIKQ